MNRVNMGIVQRTQIANRSVQNKHKQTAKSNNFTLDNWQSSDQSGSFTYKQYDNMPCIEYGRQVLR